MTFQEFLEKYNGKKTDFDGWYGAQCMDLMHRYVYDVLGLTDKTVLAASSAKDVYLNFENVGGSGYFEQIPNTPTGIPKEGDIVFWGTKIGPYGHVAIFIEGDTNKFRSFDQNFPTGSPPHVQEHSYVGCLGWLRLKGNVPDLQGQINSLREERDRNWTWFVRVCEALKVGASVELAEAEARKFVELDDVLRQKETQFHEVQVKIQDLEQRLASFATDHEQLVARYAEVILKADEGQKMVDNQGEQIKTLVTQLQELKQASQEPTLMGWRKVIHDWVVRI